MAINFTGFRLHCWLERARDTSHLQMLTHYHSSKLKTFSSRNLTSASFNTIGIYLVGDV